MTGRAMNDNDANPVIVGAGLAGLAVALSLAPRPVTVLAASALGAGASTAWAQGGIAAAVGADDTAALHLADTLAAGDGLCDPRASASILDEGASAIERLRAWGVGFDTDAGGTLRLGLEAAHARRRIVHAAGDGTGRVVLAALVARVQASPQIRVIENVRVRDILCDPRGRVAGVMATRGEAGATLVLPASAVVIATGGMGALFSETTNPLGSTGTGLALASRAGAVLAGLEFVQFHPTAIDGGGDPMPLASEAVRGEGAVLIDEDGRRFMTEGAAELSPRDVVARAIAAQYAAGHRVFLDARAALGTRFAERFPGVFALCQAAGFDPATTPIPVRPAAHYSMGGIVTDQFGAARGVDGLYACGEAAWTGLHGANRLASNSLLEAAVMGPRVAASIGGRSARAVRLPRVDAAASPTVGSAARIRPIMSRGFGVLRDEAGMTRAASSLLALEDVPGIDADALSVALGVAAGALARRESRGAHARTDTPARAAVAAVSPITLHAARDALAEVVGGGAFRRATA